MSLTIILKNKLSIRSNPRFYIYFLAFLIRTLIAPFFRDPYDYPAFIETCENILLHGKGLYYQPTVYNPFVYFPLAYIAILPGMALYYVIGIENVYLERICLKLPVILADLWLAYLFKDELVPLYKKKEGKEINNYYSLSVPEFLLIFNPFLIYSSAVKPQFFNLSVICMIYGWKLWQKQKDFWAGMWLASAILIKQYSIVFVIFLGWYTLIRSWKRALKMIGGAITISILVLGVGALSNYKGMIELTILYNFSKNPTGYSLTSIIFSFLNFFGEQYSSLSYLSIIAKVVLYLGTAIVLGSFIVLAYKIWKNRVSEDALMKLIIIAFIITFAFGKQFLYHYVPIIIALWLKYKSLSQEKINDVVLSWNMALIPIMLIIRIKAMIPEDISLLLGSYWALIVTTFFLIIHVIILLILYKHNYQVFLGKKMKYFYVLIMLSIVIGIVIQVELDAIMSWLGLAEQ